MSRLQGSEPSAAPIRVALDAAGVRWCRLRDRDGGDEDDLLIHPGDLATARRALAAVGYVEIRHPGHGTHHAFVGYDESTGRWPKVDVVTAIDLGRWQEWRTTLADGVLQRRTERHDGWRPADDDAFWTLLAHELLDRPGAPLRRLDRLRDAAAGARPSDDGGRWAAPLLPRGWTPERVIATAADGDVDALRELARGMRRRLDGQAPFATRRRRMSARILRRLDRMDPPFIRRGLTVALLGPDGAGKSSLAETLGADGPLPRRSVYLGLYGGRRRAGGSGSSTAGRRRRVPGLATVGRLASMWRGGFAGSWHRHRGRIVVFDRHPYDARLGSDTGTRGRLRRAVLGRALPRPDVVLVLDAPATVLVARKAEHPLERIEEQRRRYLALAGSLPATGVIDVSGSIESVRRRATAVAWRARAARAADR